MLLLILIVLLLLYIYWHLETRRPEGFPPGPKWYPFLGSSQTLRKDMQKYGSIFAVYEHWQKKYNSSVIGFKMDGQYNVVALDYQSVNKIHTNENFEGRPLDFFFKIRAFGTRLGITSADGPSLMQHRSFTLKHLREAGYGRPLMEIALQDELVELSELIKEKGSEPIYPGPIFAANVLNVLWIFTAGRKIGRDNDNLKRLLALLRQRSKAFDISGGLLNQLPWLRFIAPERTGYNLIKRFNKEMSNFLMEVIDEHRTFYTEEKGSDDLIYAYLKAMMNADEKYSTFTLQQLTIVILDIFIAGAETTSNTLDLAIMTMAAYPEIQARVQKELDSVLSGDELPNLDHRNKMPYLEAVILEVQRFYHILPVTGPRRNYEETTLGNYRIPKNTKIFIGLRAVMIDEEYWGDPEVFRPERFLDENMNIINTERCIPFGQGRRRCLGELLARACLFIYFSGILRQFSVKMIESDGKNRNLVPGIILTPKPYKVSFERRITKIL